MKSAVIAAAQASCCRSNSSDWRGSSQPSTKSQASSRPGLVSPTLQGRGACSRVRSASGSVEDLEWGAAGGCDSGSMGKFMVYISEIGGLPPRLRLRNCGWWRESFYPCHVVVYSALQKLFSGVANASVRGEQVIPALDKGLRLPKRRNIQIGQNVAKCCCASAVPTAPMDTPSTPAGFPAQAF